jgi:hypothetical protein
MGTIATYFSRICLSIVLHSTCNAEVLIFHSVFIPTILYICFAFPHLCHQSQSLVVNYFQKTRKDRTRHLLDLLPKKNIHAFEHFVQALKGSYPWLSEQLEAEGPESYQVEEKSFFDSLLLGGLPQSPPHNVERKEKVEYDLLHCVHLFRQLHKGVIPCLCIYVWC